jgi:hypothetical protein
MVLISLRSAPRNVSAAMSALHVPEAALSP